jgi:hypothetical protein
MKRNDLNIGTLLNELPQAAEPDVSAAWSRLRVRMHESGNRKRIQWTPVRTWSVAVAGALAIAMTLVVTVAPIRAWAESLLAIFRVEHVAVLDVNSSSVKALGNDQVFNQAMSRIISDDVKVVEPPQKPQPVADAAAASRVAGFKVHLIAGETPGTLMVRNTITAQIKLDRDRLQSILDEAGRSDLRIPGSVDGAVIGLRVPAGILAFYGNCGDTMKRWEGQNAPNAAAAPRDATCVQLSELPSPTASFPQEIDPAQIAQVGLQFAGLSPTEAANFTQTVDWTTTLVLPVLHGQTTYEKVSVNGIEAVLLRPRMAGPSGRYDLVWVDNGVVYSLMGTGDDTNAINLASQIE